MGFLLNCPNCGARDVYEFRFGGEVKNRPTPDATNEEWTYYLYKSRNIKGTQQEWWYHTLGCRKWLQAIRDTETNHVQKTSWPGNFLS